jgi:hypothetical protein
MIPRVKRKDFIECCQRCGLSHRLQFYKFTQPTLAKQVLPDSHGLRLSSFAICPTTNEPIIAFEKFAEPALRPYNEIRVSYGIRDGFGPWTAPESKQSKEAHPNIVAETDESLSTPRKGRNSTRQIHPREAQPKVHPRRKK